MGGGGGGVGGGGDDEDAFGGVLWGFVGSLAAVEDWGVVCLVVVRAGRNDNAVSSISVQTLIHDCDFDVADPEAFFLLGVCLFQELLDLELDAELVFLADGYLVPDLFDLEFRVLPHARADLGLGGFAPVVHFDAVAGLEVLADFEGDVGGVVVGVGEGGAAVAAGEGPGDDAEGGEDEAGDEAEGKVCAFLVDPGEGWEKGGFDWGGTVRRVGFFGVGVAWGGYGGGEGEGGGDFVDGGLEVGFLGGHGEDVGGLAGGV